MNFVFISLHYLLMQLLALVNMQALMHFISPGFTVDYLLPGAFVVATIARFATKDFRARFMFILGFILGVFVAYFNTNDQVQTSMLMLRYGLVTGISLVISHAGARYIEEWDYKKFILGPIPITPPLMALAWQVGFLWMFSEFISTQNSQIMTAMLVLFLPTLIGALIFFLSRYAGVFVGTLIFGEKYLRSIGLYLASKMTIATLCLYGLASWLKPQENILIQTFLLGISFVIADIVRIMTKKLMNE